MKIQITQVPYDSGHRSVRMGRGPEHFVLNGVDETLRRNGHEVYADTVEATSSF